MRSDGGCSLPIWNMTGKAKSGKRVTKTYDGAADLGGTGLAQTRLGTGGAHRQEQPPYRHPPCAVGQTESDAACALSLTRTKPRPS